MINVLKQEYNACIAKDSFTLNVKTPQKNKFQKNIQQNNNTYACKINIKKFESTLQLQYQKQKEEIKELKEKYENAREKQMKMEKIYNELKVKYQKETKNSQQLQRKIDRLNQAKQTLEEVAKSLRNLT